MSQRTAQSQARVDQFAELLSQGLTHTECKIQMGLTKGEAAATMRRIRADLGAQAV